MGIYRFTTFSTMAWTAASMRCSACCRMAVQVLGVASQGGVRRLSGFTGPLHGFVLQHLHGVLRLTHQTVAVPAGLLGQCPGSALGLGLLLQKPLLRRLQLVYFFTVQFTHRLS